MAAINSGVNYQVVAQNTKNQEVIEVPSLDERVSKVASAIFIAFGLIGAGAGVGAIVGTVIPGLGTAIGAASGALIGLICAAILIVKMVSQHLQFTKLQNEVEDFIKDKDSITLPKALELISRIEQFQAKHKGSYSLDISEVKALQDSLLNTVQVKAGSEFNRLRAKVVDFTIKEGNATDLGTATSLISEIREFEENFGNYSPDGKLTGLIFARAAEMEYHIEKRDTENLKNKVLLIIKPDVPSFDLITSAIAMDDNPLTADEVWFSKQFAKKFPNLSAAKTKYRSLKNQELDITGPKKGFLFNGVEIDCRRLNPSDKFFVHTTASDAILKKMIAQGLGGTICASLISGNTSYFHPEGNIAIMLAVDPACIATTAKEDIQSPMLNPAKDSHHQVTAQKYYDFHRKFQVLATYVDLIYSNFYGPEAPDDFTLYQKFLVQEEVVGIKIRKYEEFCVDLTSDNPEHRKLKEQLTELKNFQAKLKIQINTLKETHKNDPIFQSKNQWKVEGVTSVQLRSLIDHFKDSPNADTPENFKRIFGREGANVCAELEKCYAFVQEVLSTGDALSKMNVSRFLDPDELLAQTHSSMDNGYFDYNEVGLDLRSEMGFEPDMLKVKGILIDRQLALSKNPSNEVSQLIKTAQEKVLPIFYRD